jgi:hypothetical protein
MEAKNLILNLLSEKKPYEIVSRAPEVHEETTIAIGERSVSDTSLTVNDLRSRKKGEAIIHSYFPDFIIRHGPDVFLRLLESWHESITTYKTVEFYLLPKNSFQEVERKIMSIVDGVIEFKVTRSGKGFGLSFVPMRCCKTEYHLKEYPYKIEHGKVLIQWDGEFVDTLPNLSFQEISKRIDFYKKYLPYIRIVGGVEDPSKLSPDDYWLLSQIENNDLFTIKVLFPEIFEEVLKKIAKWNIRGFIKVIKEDNKIIDESKYNIGKKTGITTKIGLNLPVNLSHFIFSAKSGHINSVPTDIYMAEKRAIFEFIKMLFGDDTQMGTESINSMLNLEEKFHEVIGRITSAERIRKMGEDVNITLDIKFLPKIVHLLLRIGYNLNCDIKQISPTVYHLTVFECFHCTKIKSEIPICKAISGAIMGACSQAFKRKIYCKEIECKAIGHKECVFEVIVKE